ncbi:MAG: GTPase Era [Patescibacteria group bacterium]|nr:GTPase Era [Patescibacteria group bacterium]
MKSGLVTIIGRSNVGKSTLLNTMVGSKVAITTPKPQTTRLPISGIINRPLGQAVVVDTPGIMQKAKDPLTQKLLSYAKESLHGVDAVVYVVDPTRALGDEEKQAMKMIEAVEKPKLLVINMIDDKASRNYIDYYRDLATQFDNYVEVSALTGKNTDLVERWIFDQLPEGEAMYPEFQFTNLSNEVWLSELIREKLFLRLREEVPYTTHVEVNAVEPRSDKLVYVNATIYTNAERYKPMIIGKGGQGIKEIGQSVRNELEAVTNQKYYLELDVKTDPHWLGKFE